MSKARVGPILLVAGLLVGCASLTPEQRASVDEIRLFTTNTAKLYRLWKPS
jgi:hypothetical protein